MKVRVATVGLAHPFEIGFDQADRLLEETNRELDRVGLECIDTKIVLHDYESVKKAAEKIKSIDFDILVVCVATWSEDHHLLDLLSFRDVPVIIRGYPHRETGSLCCSHQIGAVFTEIDKKYEYVFGEADSPDCAEETKQIALAYALANKFNKAKVGTVGGRVQGMTEIAYDEFDIKQKIGARVINIDEMEMIEKIESVSDNEAKAVMESFKQRNYKITSQESHLLESMKYYLGLKKLVEQYDLDCLSVKCYTKYMGKVCLGYSLLAEEGIMCGCEGDVTNTLSMQILYELSGKPVNNTDLLYMDEEKNTGLYAHCGSSGFAIADGEVNIAPVRLAETGCCSLFTAMPGDVTLLNIVGRGEKFRLSTMTGEALHCGMEFPGNPTVVKHKKPIAQINKEIMAQGVGHHWMVGYGDYTEVLERFCAIKNIKYISV